jgi:hypothetical protein
MERVVYILGAGFSAPLGLPVVRNFLFRAKDLFFQEPRGREYFHEVFQEIDRLSKIKHYFDSDQFDIEEILSILEMGEQFEGRRLREKDLFVRFLIDVVKSHSKSLPHFHSPPPSPTPFSAPWNGYLCVCGCPARASPDVERWSASAGTKHYVQRQLRCRIPQLRHDG